MPWIARDAEVLRGVALAGKERRDQGDDEEDPDLADELTREVQSHADDERGEGEEERIEPGEVPLLVDPGGVLELWCGREDRDPRDGAHVLERAVVVERTEEHAEQRRDEHDREDRGRPARERTVRRE